MLFDELELDVILLEDPEPEEVLLDELELETILLEKPEPEVVQLDELETEVLLLDEPEPDFLLLPIDEEDFCVDEFEEEGEDEELEEEFELFSSLDEEEEFVLEELLVDKHLVFSSFNVYPSIHSSHLSKLGHFLQW